jgi:general secretion pathway protein A
MYLNHYGLRAEPFEMTPDSRTLFLSDTHKQGLATLKNGVTSNSGFLVLTGGVGTGKTTLIKILAKELKDTHYLCILSNPILEPIDFYHYFAEKLGILYDGNKTRFLLMFSQLLEKCLASARKVLLIIDEAHVLPFDLFEELRFLENVSAEQQNVLSIFLVGQPELLDRLAEDDLKSIQQRIGIRFHLEPLSRQDVFEYIYFRLNFAGANMKRKALFTEKAIDLVHQATGGVPRIINVLCDNALLAGYTNKLPQVDHMVVRGCVEKLYFPGDGSMFALPPEKTFWQKWLVWMVVGALVVEGVGLWLAYKYGLLDFVRKLFS